ncbi:MAG: prephenate dehydratase, partial [Polyangiaceae bacterium]
ALGLRAPARHPVIARGRADGKAAHFGAPTARSAFVASVHPPTCTMMRSPCAAPALASRPCAILARVMALDDLRTRIDGIDDRILSLLDERAGAMADVAAAKRGAELPTYDPDRERRVLDRLSSRAGRFPAEAIRAVYREVMSACLALQEPLKVAYLGPEGTFSHAAAREFFGLSAQYSEATTFDGVFDAVTRNQATYGIVPIENSSEGSVPHAVDALVGGELLIRAELHLEVSQCLLTRASGLPAIERVYSHPQPLGQCRMWLAKNLASAQLVQASSTTSAVREAMTDPGGAAIASALASELYGLPVMRERIQDRAENFTRFIIVAHEDAARTGDDKTTVAFSLQDGRGALLRALAVFDAEDINLSRIESRPSREKSWDYVFLADLLGHRQDAKIARAMTRLRESCPLVKHLGSYPRARPAAPSDAAKQTG